MGITATPLRKALSTNSVATDFTAKTPLTAAPTNAGVFKLTDGQYGIGVDGRVPERIQLIPFGGNDSNDVFNMRVWGWSKDGGNGTFWVPQLLVELACTLGNISAANIAASMLLVDTLVVTYGSTDEKALGVSVMSPANDVAGSALLHVRGSEYIEFDFDLSTNCDAMNCLWRAMDQH